MLKVGGLAPFTTIDYPGQLSAVVFCQGCPWRCGYCHNRHLQPRSSSNEIPWSEVVEFLKARVGVLDAVVFSGGEPTMQDGVVEAIKTVSMLGFKTALHTSGSNPLLLAKCLPQLSWVGMDIKAPFEDYHKITGIADSGVRASESSLILRGSSVEKQFRTTVDPFLEKEGRIQRMQELVRGWGYDLVLQAMRDINVKIK